MYMFMYSEAQIGTWNVAGQMVQVDVIGVPNVPPTGGEVSGQGCGAGDPGTVAGCQLASATSVVAPIATPVHCAFASFD